MRENKDKYGNMPAWRRTVNKNAGFIVVGVTVVVLYFLWGEFTDSQEFFQNWGCLQIENYMLDGITYGYTPHNELTEEQHLKLHAIYEQDCTGNRMHDMP